ncbi:hypothetical protein [Streptomyces sp. NPDC056323]
MAPAACLAEHGWAGGWPDLTPRFLAEFGLRLGKHRTACVRGKI